MPKLYHMELEEHNGEQEYSYDFLIYAKNEEEAWQIARNYARTFYGEDDFAGKEPDTNVFEFMYGCIIVEIKGLYETTKDIFMEHMLFRYTLNHNQK
ncbi:MAG: hypothetical protein ABFD82_13560 [Syntrophaceae bacterium]